MKTAVARARETIDQKKTSKQKTSQFWKDDIHDRILYKFQKNDTFNIDSYVQITSNDWSISCHVVWREQTRGSWLERIRMNSNEQSYLEVDAFFPN